MDKANNTKAKLIAVLNGAPEVLKVALLLVILGGTLAMLSLQRLFWCDELLVVSLVEVMPASDLLEALRKGADGGFPLPYYIFSSWSTVTGPEELLWRIPSILAGLLTALAVYAGSRVFVARGPALICATVGTIGSTMFLRHAAEVRFYSFYYMGAAVMWMALAMLFETRAEKNRAKLIALGFLLLIGNTILVMSHQFGIVYSALLFGVWALCMWNSSISKIGAACMFCAPAWLLFFSYLPLALEQKKNLVGDTQVYGQPHFSDLIKVYLQLLPGFSYEGLSENKAFVSVSVLLTLLLWVLIITRAVVLLRVSSKRFHLQTNARYLLSTAVVLLCVPAFFWVLAQIGPSFLLYRYMLPTQIGFMLLLLVLMTTAPYNSLKMTLVGWLVGALIIAWSFVGLLGVNTRNVAAVAESGRKTPILSFSLAEFYAALRYSPHIDIYYLLDDEIARLNARTFSHALAEQAIQQARKKLGITERIVIREELDSLSSEFKVSAYNQHIVGYFENVGFDRFDTLQDEEGNLIIRRKISEVPRQ